MKKFLSIVLAVAIIICAMPLGVFTFTASAETQYYTEGNYDYKVENGEAIITYIKDRNIGGILIVPSMLGGYPVTSIGKAVFRDCLNIHGVVIPDSVISIGEKAFFQCRMLNDIDIPNSVKTIGNDAFLDTAYYKNESNWQNDLLYIDNYLLDAKNKISGDCIIKDGTEIIANGAFFQCDSLQSVTIANSVKIIGDQAFIGCGNLSSVIIPNGVESINDEAFRYCTSLTNITVPNSVIHLGKSAFSNCTNLINAELSNSLSSINDGLFFYCEKLTEITIPYSVTSIGNNAFSYCTSFTTVTIHKGISNIGEKAFSSCINLLQFLVDDNNEYYSSYEGILFSKDKTTLIAYPAAKTGDTYIIPDDVTTISCFAFCKCKNLEELTISKNVTSIGDNAFAECDNFETLNYNAINYSNRGINLFYKTTINKINIGDEVKVVPKNMFSFSKITSITIPNSVIVIEDRAFSSCYNLSDVNIYSNIITTIGNNVFSDTAYYNNETNWIDNSLYINNYLFEIKAAEGDYVVKDGTKVIADHIFDNRKNLTSLTVPDSVINIGDNTFYNCIALQKIDVSAGNKLYRSIEGVLFDYNIKKLIRFPSAKTDEVYIIPEGVEIICNYAFYQCKNITTIVFPETATSIGEQACGNCSKLEYVFIPKAVTSIGAHAFFNIIIYGYNGSFAQTYAVENKFDFFAFFDSVNSDNNNVWENVTVNITGVYDVFIALGEGSNGSSNSTPAFAIYDKDGKDVYYNLKKGGYPLVKGEKYTIVAHNYILAYKFSRKDTIIFSDTSSKGWYNDAVTYAVGAGIMGGYSNGLFGTSDSIQRQDFLVMLARLDGVNLDNYKYKSSFPDVARNSYYEAAVNWGAKNGIVTGYDSGKFGVGDKVTREQLVTFLYRYAKYKGYDYSYTTDRETTVSGQYIDYKNVSGFAKDSILWAIEKGVISGKTSSTIVPQGNAQRCEVAKIMYNIYVNDIFK